MLQRLDGNDTLIRGRDLQVQGMTALMPSMEVQVGTGRINSKDVKGRPRFPSLLNGSVVALVLETCEMISMWFKTLTHWVDDCTTKTTKQAIFLVP